MNEKCLHAGHDLSFTLGHHSEPGILMRCFEGRWEIEVTYCILFSAVAINNACRTENPAMIYRKSWMFSNVFISKQDDDCVSLYHSKSPLIRGFSVWNCCSIPVFLWHVSPPKRSWNSPQLWSEDFYHNWLYNCFAGIILCLHIKQVRNKTRNTGVFAPLFRGPNQWPSRPKALKPLMLQWRGKPWEALDLRQGFVGFFVGNCHGSANKNIVGFRIQDENFWCHDVFSTKNRQHDLRKLRISIMTSSLVAFGFMRLELFHPR